MALVKGFQRGAFAGGGIKMIEPGGQNAGLRLLRRDIIQSILDGAGGLDRIVIGQDGMHGAVMKLLGGAIILVRLPLPAGGEGEKQKRGGHGRKKRLFPEMHLLFLLMERTGLFCAYLCNGKNEWKAMLFCSL